MAAWPALATCCRVSEEEHGRVASIPSTPATWKYADRPAYGLHPLRMTTASEAPVGPGGGDDVLARWTMGRPWHDHRGAGSSSLQLRRNPAMLPNHAVCDLADFPSNLNARIPDTHRA